MGWLRYLRRRQWDRERGGELDAYLDQETADNIDRGMTPNAARAAARRKLGNVTLIREEIYRMNTLGFFEALWQDLRYGIRMMRQSPGLTAVALLSLALGIGATTSIFSVVYGVLIAPYPYSHPEQIWATGFRSVKNPTQWSAACRVGAYLRIKTMPTWSATMATLPDNRLLGGGRQAESFQTVQVTANAFQFLGVEAALGRTILPSDVGPGGKPEAVIVLAEKAWQRLFNGRADALGQKLVLNDVAYTVIGVMPSRFGWWTDDGGWIPLDLDSREQRSVFPIARLASGVSPEAAEQQLDALFGQLVRESPADYPTEPIRALVKNYMDMTTASGTMEASLRLLFGAVGFLLLIACANVANLQLVRATARAREIALRMAVGAGGSRVLRQLLTENVLLAAAGGLLGIALAKGITVGIEALMPEFYKPNEARITLNWYVLGFTASVAILTGVLFGLAPALECARLNLVETLKEAGRGGGAGARGSRMRNGLVVVEVALSVVLVVGAALTVRGFVQLQKTALGFHPERVLLVNIQLPAKRYATWERRIAFARQLMDRVATIPGALSAAIGNGGLPFGGMRSPYSIDGQASPASQPMVVALVSEQYPRTLGIPLVAGRDIDAQDVAHADPIAMINQTAARLWPAATNPVGRRIHLKWLENPQGMLPAPGPHSGDVTIVGVIGDTRNDGLTSPTLPQVFLPYTLAASVGRGLVIRANDNPMQLLNAVRAEVSQLDKEVPVNRPILLDEVVGFEVKQPRFNMALFTFFGALGLALATIGIFGLLSYSVARRSHELGVRMALGADRRRVLQMVIGLGARLVFTGLALGLLGSFALARYLRSEVFSVPIGDPVSIGGAVLVLIAASLSACVIPARRAARLEPMSALRRE